jgi:glycosyltransferase involved in cell wall biosynthesis
VSEGFGLPPLEALACGCVLFSSLNHALADSLDPGRLGHQIGAGTLEADLDAITAAAAEPAAWLPAPEALAGLLASSGETALIERWRGALAAIDRHWDRLEQGCPPLRSEPVWQQRWRQRLERLGKLKRLWAQRQGT